MIVHYGGVIADKSSERLSSDAVPALFSYSLNRATRKLYTGDYFQFRQGSTIKEYPTDPIDPNQTAYLVKLYDQKEMHSVPVRDAVQVDQSKQPEIVNTSTYVNDLAYTFPASNATFSAPYTQVKVINKWHPHLTAGNNYDLVQVQITGGVLSNMKFGNTSAGSQWIGLGGGRGVDWEVQKVDSSYLSAVFDQNEYLDLEVQDVAQNIGQNFTITSIGDGGDFPRPMIGIWGSGSDRITVEPSDQATRFTFNNNRGTILDSDGSVTQCYSGPDPEIPETRVIEIDSGTNHARLSMSSQSPSLTHISVGREDQRLYKGDFSEASMHLGNLTRLGSEQLFATIRSYYGY